MTDLEKFQAAIDQALAEHTEGFPTAWVLVAAIAGEEDILATYTSPRLPYWQKHGLLSQGALTTAGQPEWTHEEDDDA